MGAGQLGERHQVMHALGLDRRRPRRLVPLGAGLALGQQLPLQLRDERLVLAVGGDDHAQLLGQRQRVIQLGVVDAEGALVGQEDLERRDAVGDDLAKLRLGVASSNRVTPMWNV